MSTVSYKEKLDVSRNTRWTKKQMKEIYAFCKKNKVQFSDLVRESVMRTIQP